MKSYNHLYEKYISADNIRLAVRNSSKGKRDKKIVKRYLPAMTADDNSEIILKIQSIAANFRSAHHTPVEIYDGISRKKRTIIVPKYSEQIIHHMVINVMSPILEHGMYEHSYASLPNRGAHRGKKAIEKWIRKHPRSVKYCLKMDIRKFFESISHKILMTKFEKIIHDQKFLKVIEEILSATDKGLPLGFYTSQWFANWYLNGLDHYIKEDLCAAHYIRYMDDMVIFGSNKRKLHRIRKAVETYLKNHLDLKLKGNWQVFRFDYTDKSGEHHGRFLDFMGFRFYRDKTTLRKSIMLKATRKARCFDKKDRVSTYEIRQMLSYLGWLDCTDTYKMYLKLIKPFVNFQYCKRRISAYDKRKNEEVNNGMVSNRING